LMKGKEQKAKRKKQCNGEPQICCFLFAVCFLLLF